MDLDLTENHFINNNNTISTYDNNTNIDNNIDNDLEIIEKVNEPQIIIRYNNLGKLNEIEDYNYIEINSKFIQTNYNTKEISTQTDNDEIIYLKKELLKLQTANIKLVNNFKDIAQLINVFTKIDLNNPQIDIIRTQLTILVNRELRMKYPFPFINLLSKSSK